MYIVQVHCIVCKERICTCGEEYKFWAQEGRDKLTKAVNGFTVEDIFKWLAKKDYLSDDYKTIYEEFKKEH